jgi:hypothetical protein
MKTMNCVLGVVLATLFGTVASAWAQERAQADVLIQSVNVKEFNSGVYPNVTTLLSAEVAVYNYNDDGAANVMLTVLLPVEVRLVSASPNCAAIPTLSGAYDAAVQCHMGTFGVGQSKKIQITTTLPRLSVVKKTFGAFAWGLISDPQPGNNYLEGTVTP